MSVLKPCIDCGALSQDNRCQTHKRAAQARWKSGKENPYLDPAWKKISSQLRSKRGWCEVCGTTADLTVDHLDPVSQGGPLLAPEHRLRVLCRTCHGRLTRHKK